jgi:hypothetical protein
MVMDIKNVAMIILMATGTEGIRRRTFSFTTKKQKSIDDRTKKPVSVLSITGGVVVAVGKDWNQSSMLRGGKYIWIYDPTRLMR